MIFWMILSFISKIVFYLSLKQKKYELYACVLQKLRNACFYVKKKKYIFYTIQVIFLIYIISNNDFII